MPVAFIDHSFHKKTKSSQFFIDYLNAKFKVDLFWDQSWSGGEPVSYEEVNRGNYELIFFWQILYDKNFLTNFICQKLVFIPMYDSRGDKKGSFWLPFRRYYFISFSKATHRNLTRLGIRSFHIQYFPNPEEFLFQAPANDPSIFFWARTQQITWSKIKILLSNLSGVKVWFHVVPDPENTFEHPSLNDFEDFSITESSWFEVKTALYRTILQHNIYIAPRPSEGIGMSFLEAMAMGRCVVAVNQPTMNEYIQNGRNGLLFSLAAPRPLSSDKSFAIIGSRARRSIEKGYLRYTAKLTTLTRTLTQINGAWPWPRLTVLSMWLTILGRVWPYLRRVKRRIVGSLK